MSPFIPGRFVSVDVSVFVLVVRPERAVGKIQVGLGVR